MLSFQSLRTRLQNLTGDSDSATNTLFNALLNDTQHTILAFDDWDFTERSTTTTTTASTQTYDLPYNYQKMKRVTITVGSIAYPVEPVDDQELWDELNARSFTSNIPQYYFIRNQSILFYPTPSSSSNTITFYYHILVKDLSQNDYTTGTITTLANGGTAVTGSSTVWTAAFVGRWFKIDSDGYWYEIATRSSNTSIALDKAFQGTAIAAGSENYTIGEMPVLPEGYHELLVWRPAAIYYMQKEAMDKAKAYWMLYDGGYELGQASKVGGLLGRMKRERSNKSTVSVVPSRNFLMKQINTRNPNNYPTGLDD